MTRNEFDQWYRKFKGAMPSINAWFKKQDGDIQAELADRWYKTLIGCELSDALTGITEMFEGRLEKNREWEKVVWTISRFAKQRAFERRKRSHMVDGYATVGCRECNDEGHVACWSLQAMDSVRRAIKDDNEWDGSHHGTVSQFACTCQAGDRFYAFGLGRFEADTHVRHLPSLTRKENIEALLARIKAPPVATEWTPT